jgi:hypothetical protein
MTTPTTITAACDYFRATPTSVRSDSTLVASYEDGTVLVAVKNNRTVVSINSYPGVNRQWTGQMDALIHNAIWYLASPPPS